MKVWLGIGWLLCVAMLSLTQRGLGAERPLTPEQSAAGLTVPDGFHATLFAGEPDVVQPIAMTFDARGRLWVVECLSYPDWNRNGEGRDRVSIFEDVDGDGRFDRKRLFWDRGVNLSGIELGFGGVWLCATPELIFIPDRNGDDQPDGPPEVLLDGWDLDASHNVFNGLIWGPDGWLYGCNGILSRSPVGRPGATDDQRTPLDCGVWRYHPTQHRFEVVAWGTTNPWGLDYDAYGQLFITNCVIKHLFHVVPGIHMTRMFGQDLNPFAYHLVGSCADHLHWAGGYWDTSIGGKHDDAGGGHAHAGAMIYQGDNWPAAYRERIYMHNIHGRRVNSDRLQRVGAAYVAQHADDVILSHDPWWRGLQLKYGPDGSVFLSDWNDTGECHDRENTQKGTGRILRVSFGMPQPFRGDLHACEDRELVEYQTHANEWFARQARMELQMRAGQQPLRSETAALLWQRFAEATATGARLRLLWTLHAVGETQSGQLLELLRHTDPYVRAWAVQLALEHSTNRSLEAARPVAAPVIDALCDLAATDASPIVQLYLASALQRLPRQQRWQLVRPLASQALDAADPNLGPLLWYGVEPCLPDDQAAGRELVTVTQLPLLRTSIARRIVSQGESGIMAIVDCLEEEKDPSRAIDLLAGLTAELSGAGAVVEPENWQRVRAKWRKSDHEQLRRGLDDLSLIFGDSAVVELLTRQVLDATRSAESRADVLSRLVASQPIGLETALLRLLDDPELRSAALRGLARYHAPETAREILNRYDQYSAEERHDALLTLTSRTAWAELFLEALQRKVIPLRDVTAFHATQLERLGEPSLVKRFREVWGHTQASSVDMQARLKDLRVLVQPERLAGADAERGRAIFQRKCAACHQLFGAGGQIGPDLTGAQRTDVDYLLQNIVTPNAAVPGDFLVRTYEMEDGRIVAGIVAAETPRTITVQTLNDQLVLARKEIASEVRSSLSLMPEGLLDDLNSAELADLFRYLSADATAP